MPFSKMYFMIPSLHQRHICLWRKSPHQGRGEEGIFFPHVKGKTFYAYTMCLWQMGMGQMSVGREIEQLSCGNKKRSRLRDVEMERGLNSKIVLSCFNLEYMRRQCARQAPQQDVWERHQRRNCFIYVES
jgi:hypothetical protein